MKGELLFDLSGLSPLILSALTKITVYVPTPGNYSAWTFKENSFTQDKTCKNVNEKETAHKNCSSVFDLAA